MSSWLVWLVVALALAAAELLTGGMYLLMLAGGALAAAVSSALTDWPVWADGVVFAVVSVLLTFGLRPVLQRRFVPTGELPDAMRELEGKSALVLQRVSREAGQVRLDDEVWTARSLDEDAVFEPGDYVTVRQINGATAVVY